MDKINEIKILCIATKTWKKKILSTLVYKNYVYIIQHAPLNVEQIKQRLQHNSYDILIIDYKFVSKHLKNDDILLFNKLAFAMSRPSILVCNTWLSYLKMKFSTLPNVWLNKFKTSKEFIYFCTTSHLKNYLPIINNSQSYHQYINKISSEIYNIFINQ